MAKHYLNGHTATKQGGGEEPALYVVVGWLRYCRDLKGDCQLCGANPARYTYNGYGYEGIASDSHEIDEALEAAEAGSEGEGEDRVGMLLRRRFHRTLEAQRQGDYRVVGTSDICGECVADLTEGYMDMEHAGAYTAAQLLSTAGSVSCVLAWRVFSEEKDQRKPLLLYTEARAIDEVMRHLRVLDL